MKPNSTLLLALIILCIFKLNTVKAQVNVQDSLALVDLYNSTNGPGWVRHDGWLTTYPVSTWYGVTVTSNRVTDLELSVNNLTGTIPSSIGNLTALKNLNFYFDKLTGSIPSSMGNLINLERLDLEFNNLSGDISTFNNLTKLSYLDLSGCGLTGSISFLAKLLNPQDIFLAGNQLSGKIPVMNCANLAVLDLSYNQLSGTIPVFKKDTANLYGEDGVSIQLEHNNLSGNISHQFDSIVHLYELFLNNNQLTGKIPASINKFVNLNEIVLSNNKLTGKLPALDSLKNLQYLFFDNNQLSGIIPTSLNRNTKLKEIDLSNNNLSGRLPSLDSLNRFTTLYFQNNQFTFAGMEDIASHFYKPTYSPQANVHITKKGLQLSVSAGGTVSNNTYKWYKNGSLYKTTVGDSAITIHGKGNYYVTVTNAAATALTLHSDTINYLTANNLIPDELRIENKISPVSVYPNPAKNYTMLSFNAEGKYAITITDVSGKILQAKTGVAIKSANIIQLDVSKYASGVYLITIVDEKNTRQTIKLNKE